MSAKPTQEDIDSDEEDNVEQQVAEQKEPEPEIDTSLANSDVTTKYQEAARIAQAALQEVANLCVPGAKVLDICRAGDASIEQKASLIFRGKNKEGKQVEKGIAFPVCVSVNECVCHSSPLESDDSLPPLVEGDLVKIDLGVHIDGFIVVAAHTVDVGFVANEAAPITGAKADLLAAAWTAAEVAAKLIRPGNTNAQVTEAVKKVADAYGVKPMSGTLMHQMKRYVIDGNKMILLREEPEQKVEACKFEPYEVYAIDVAMSTGEGKPREMGTRTTVYKRVVDRKYGLKVKSARALFNEVNRRFATMPFTLRAISDEKGAKLGIRECVNHELLLPYPVLYERQGDLVAHVKFTVLLLGSGSAKVGGLEFPAGYKSDKVLPEDIQAILATEDKKKKKRPSKKTKAVADAEA